MGDEHSERKRKKAPIGSAVGSRGRVGAFTAVHLVCGGNDASDALVSLDTANFHIEGKEGSWLAFDSIAVDGKEFFLMEHENGKLIVDDACHGFDQTVQRRIKDCLRPSQSDPKSAKQETPPLENWQKYMENGDIFAVLKWMKSRIITWWTASGTIWPRREEKEGRLCWRSCAKNRRRLQNAAES